MMKKLIYLLLALLLLITFLEGVSRLVYQINPMECTGCGHCFGACAVNAIYYDETVESLQIDAELCTGCGSCVGVCPFGAFYDDPGVGVIYGCVISSETGFAVRNAVVQAGGDTVLTNMSGYYSFMIAGGEYNITCTKEGYIDVIVTGVQLEVQQTCLCNFTLVPDTGIADEELEVKEVSCYPNPVKAGSEVRFYQSEGQKQVVQIFNAKGQLVRTVTEAWDLRDNYGNQVATGVYFYKENQDLNCAWSKLVIIK
jgi:ferredoxin